MNQRPVLGMIGAGKVGCALARLWYSRGYPIGAVASRTMNHAAALAEQVDSIAVPPEVVPDRADLIVLAVPDDALESVARVLARDAFAGKGVVHTSGAHDARVLTPLAEWGAMTGSLHPAFPFADVETAVQRLPGATFALEASDERLTGWLTALVQAVDGVVLTIPPGQKALYHAALVFASNYTVTLYALAESLLVGMGASRSAADGALNALVGATVENIRAQGIPAALTGPLVRSDVGTIAAHLRALAGVDEDSARLYRLLAKSTFPILEARGISPAAIANLLRQEETNATDNT